jgi:hypothetical protein
LEKLILWKTGNFVIQALSIPIVACGLHHPLFSSEFFTHVWELLFNKKIKISLEK